MDGVMVDPAVIAFINLTAQRHTAEKDDTLYCPIYRSIPMLSFSPAQSIIHTFSRESRQRTSKSAKGWFGAHPFASLFILPLSLAIGLVMTPTTVFAHFVKCIR